MSGPSSGREEMDVDQTEKTAPNDVPMSVKQESEEGLAVKSEPTSTKIKDEDEEMPDVSENGQANGTDDKREKDRKHRSKSNRDKEREKEKKRSKDRGDKERERERDKDKRSSRRKSRDKEKDKDSDSPRRKKEKKERSKEKERFKEEKDTKPRDKDKKRRSRRRDRDREYESGSRSRSRSRRRRHRSRSREDDRRKRRHRRSSERSRSRSRSLSSDIPPPRNKRRKNDLVRFWDVTPEMAQTMGVEINPWQPSPDNPYFSSAAAAAANAAAAAITNPHNVNLWKNPVNKDNMTVKAQQLSGAHAGMPNAPIAAAHAINIATTTPLLRAFNNPLLRERADMEAAKDIPVRPSSKSTVVDILSKMKEVSELSSSLARREDEVHEGPGVHGLANVVQQSNYLHASRASRRIYVGNLPHTVTEEQIRQFFNATMIAAQGPEREAGDSVTNVYLNTQKRFAFVEFRTAEEATQAMELEGIMFFGESLKIGRPANYNPSMVPEELRPKKVNKLNTARLGIVSNYVPNGPNKLYCGGIPYSLTEEQVKELLRTYGPLKAFFLAKDPSTGLSKGYCFFQYEDPSVTDEAIKGLNGIKISDRQLAVRRHTPSQSTNASSMNTFNPLNNMLGTGVSGLFGNLGNLASGLGSDVNAGGEPMSPVLCLLQMVARDMLLDDQEYKELLEDVKDECSRYGKVLSMEIPRPNSDGQDVPGTGKIYVQYSNADEAMRAKGELEGRTFDNKTVFATFYPLDKYASRIFQ